MCEYVWVCVHRRVCLYVCSRLSHTKQYSRDKPMIRINWTNVFFVFVLFFQEPSWFFPDTQSDINHECCFLHARAWCMPVFHYRYISVPLAVRDIFTTPFLSPSCFRALCHGMGHTHMEMWKSLFQQWAHLCPGIVPRPLSQSFYLCHYQCKSSIHSNPIT